MKTVLGDRVHNSTSLVKDISMYRYLRLPTCIGTLMVGSVGSKTRAATEPNVQTVSSVEHAQMPMTSSGRHWHSTSRFVNMITNFGE